jgi:hypothetical protein
LLLKTMSKKCVSSPGRKLAWSCGLRLPAARKNGRCLQWLKFNFTFFQGCLCKLWAEVITKIWMKYKSGF